MFLMFQTHLTFFFETQNEMFGRMSKILFSKVHSDVYGQKKIIIYKNILTDWNGLLKSCWDVDVILYGDTGRWLG